MSTYGCLCVLQSNCLTNFIITYSLQTKRLQNLTTAPLLSTFLLRVVVLGQRLSGKKWQRKIAVVGSKLEWNLQNSLHSTDFRKEQTSWDIQQLILPITGHIVLWRLQYTVIDKYMMMMMMMMLMMMVMMLMRTIITITSLESKIY